MRVGATVALLALLGFGIVGTRARENPYPELDPVERRLMQGLDYAAAAPGQPAPAAIRSANDSIRHSRSSSGLVTAPRSTCRPMLSSLR